MKKFSILNVKRSKNSDSKYYLKVAYIWKILTYEKKMTNLEYDTRITTI